MFNGKHCSLSLKLVDDLPGEHVYIHCCRGCGREYGPEFAMFHESTGKPNDPVPVLMAPVCGGWDGGVVAHISARFEAVYALGLGMANA